MGRLAVLDRKSYDSVRRMARSPFLTNFCRLDSVGFGCGLCLYIAYTLALKYNAIIGIIYCNILNYMPGETLVLI